MLTCFLRHAFHEVYLEFYKTGVFELAIPIPAWLSSLAGLFGVKISKGVHIKYEDKDLEKNNRYMDRIFLQCYTIPEIQIGLTKRLSLD